MIELRSEFLKGKFVRYVKRINGKNFKSSRGASKREAVAEYHQWYRRTFGAIEQRQKHVDNSIAGAAVIMDAVDTDQMSQQQIASMFIETAIKAIKKPADTSVDSIAAEFIDHMRQKTVAGKISTLKSHIRFFTDRINTIDLTCEQWRNLTNDLELANRESVNPAPDAKWSAKYCVDLLKTIKQFLRWCKTEKKITCEDWSYIFEKVGIKIPEKLPEYFSREEFQFLLDAASPEYRLILLLMLNTGSTCADVVSFEFCHGSILGVDLEAGTITRKRTKHKFTVGAPSVTYTLFPEIINYLKSKSIKTGKIFDWTIAQMDAEFDRIRQKGSTKTQKHIRKTGATCLAESDFPSNRVELYLANKNPNAVTSRYVGQTVLDPACTQYIYDKLVK